MVVRLRVIAKALLQSRNVVCFTKSLAYSNVGTKEAEIPDTRFSLKAYTESEDWNEFLPLIGKGFINSTYARRYLPDEEKRKSFVPKYFRYLYKKHFNDGRAVMIGLKTHEMRDGIQTAKAIYGGIYAYDMEDVRDVDIGELMDTYREGMEINLKRQKWLEQNIERPLQLAAKSLGTVAWHAAYQCTAPEYRNQRIVQQYTKKALDLSYEYGLQRHKRLSLPPTKIPPFDYMYLTDTAPGVWRYAKAVGRVCIGHLHYNYRSGLKCVKDGSDIDEQNLSCYHVFVHKNVASDVQRYFAKYSPGWEI